MRPKTRLLLRAAAGAAGVLFAAVAGAQTLDEVLARHLEARGGKERIDAVQTVRVSGAMTMGPGMEVPFVLEWKRPDRIRFERTVDGETGVQAYDGTTAWVIVPFTGDGEPEVVPAEQAADVAQWADFAGPLVDSGAKGHRVELVGKRRVDGREVYDLEITLASGDVVHELLDAETYLTVGQQSFQEQAGLEIETAVGDYREVGGLRFPHRFESRVKGAPAGAPTQTIVIDGYELGVEIDDARFAFPKAEAMAPEPD